MTSPHCLRCQWSIDGFAALFQPEKKILRKRWGILENQKSPSLKSFLGYTKNKHQQSIFGLASANTNQRGAQGIDANQTICKIRADLKASNPYGVEQIHMNNA